MERAVQSSLPIDNGPRATADGVITGASNESSASGVSWAAVVAGALAASALSLVLLALGAGLASETNMETVLACGNLAAPTAT